MPVSKAVVATILLFNGVFNWNDYEGYKTSIGYQKVLDYQTKKVAENKAKVGMK